MSSLTKASRELFKRQLDCVLHNASPLDSGRPPLQRRRENGRAKSNRPAVSTLQNGVVDLAL